MTPGGPTLFAKTSEIPCGPAIAGFHTCGILSPAPNGPEGLRVFKKRDQSRLHIEEYLGRLYGYAVSLCNDRERARDLLQTAAVKAITAKNVPVDEPAFRAWLFTILRNAFHDEMRRERSYLVSLEEKSDADDEEWNRLDALNVLSMEQMMINTISVRTALERIGVRYREVLALVDMAGFSYQEAADMVGVPIGTIMSRLSRARKLLLAELGADQAHVIPLDVARRKKNAQ